MTGLLDFEVLSERWGRAPLSDGSVLLLRSTLAYLRFDPKNRKEYETRVATSIVVAAKPSLRGRPSSAADAINRKVVRTFEKIGMDPLARSLYVLPSQRIALLVAWIEGARKTNQFDARGDPVYNVDFKTEILLLGEIPAEPLSVPSSPKVKAANGLKKGPTINIRN